MADNPVILIVTGAWHVPEQYSKLSYRLRHSGYTVECPRLLTNNNAEPPNKCLDDDVGQIRDLALRILSEGKNIVAVMHSYGGMVGTSAFSGMDGKSRKGQACVKALVYMAAFVPFEHESLAGIFGGGLPPFLQPNDSGCIDIIDPAKMFYHDLPASEQAEAVSQLVTHPTIAQFDSPKEPVTEAAWKSIPTTYLFCKDDQALPLGVQEMMCNRMQESHQDLGVHREYVDSSHSPFLSMPDDVAKVIDGVCARMGG